MRYRYAALATSSLLFLGLLLAACAGSSTQPAARTAVPSAQSAPSAPAAVASVAASAQPASATASVAASPEGAAIPVGQTPEGYWYLGRPDAPVTLTNYSDFL